jgi:glycosyltransferase involved in cell wall biosynthesis
MLSSIGQLKQNDKIKMRIALAFLNNIKTEIVAILFEQCGLKIDAFPYMTIGELQSRGYTRSDMIKECLTEWILFTDSDHVYHPEWFVRLREYIRQNKLTKYDGIITAGRTSCDPGMADRLVSSSGPYPIVIADAWKNADTLDIRKMGNVGAGHTQLINLKFCQHGGYYVEKGKSRDGKWIGGIQKARSDMQFRKRISKLHKLPAWFGRNQRHLNHKRDNEVGYHLEIMR